MSNGQSRQRELKRLENFTKGQIFFDNSFFSFTKHIVTYISYIASLITVQHSTY